MQFDFLPLIVIIMRLIMPWVYYSASCLKVSFLHCGSGVSDKGTENRYTCIRLPFR